MENRHYPRVAVEQQCKARFQLGGKAYNDITVSNLGEDGCCLSGPTQSLNALSNRAMLDNWQLIHPALPGDAIKARVVWVTREKQGTSNIIHSGIEFQNAPTGFTQRVGKYVTTLAH